METENKKGYEMSYLLSADVTEDKIDSITTELNGLLKESGADGIKFDLPLKKRLAFPIKKQSETYFGVVYFGINNEALDKIKKALALNKKILRFLILNNPSKPAPVNAAMPVPEKTEKTVKPTAPESPATSFDEKLESILRS